MGLPKPAAIRRLIQTQDLREGETGARVARIHSDFLERMQDYYRTDPSVREVPGTSATFQALRAGGVRVALDTGFSRPIVEAILERLPWRREGLLDTTVTSDEVARGRPFPDMVFRAMAKTGDTDPRRVAKDGDTPADLQEGDAAGCGWVIGVTAGTHTRAELLPYPHTHLIETVAELASVLPTRPADLSVAPF
jgi:phosphonatase-like hydrolase